MQHAKSCELRCLPWQRGGITAHRSHIRILAHTSWPKEASPLSCWSINAQANILTIHPVFTYPKGRFGWCSGKTTACMNMHTQETHKHNKHNKHTLSLSLCLPFAFPLFPFLSLSPSLSLCHAHSYSHACTHVHNLCLSLPVALFLSRILSSSYSLSCRIHTHSCTRTHIQYHTPKPVLKRMMILNLLPVILWYLIIN